MPAACSRCSPVATAPAARQAGATVERAGRDPLLSDQRRRTRSSRATDVRGRRSPSTSLNDCDSRPRTTHTRVVRFWKLRAPDPVPATDRPRLSRPVRRQESCSPTTLGSRPCTSRRSSESRRMSAGPSARAPGAGAEPLECWLLPPVRRQKPANRTPVAWRYLYRAQRGLRSQSPRPRKQGASRIVLTLEAWNASSPRSCSSTSSTRRRSSPAPTRRSCAAV